MHLSKILVASTICLLFHLKVYSQEFLNTYFNGNKDSLIFNANKLINMPEPSFEAYTPNHNDTLKSSVKNGKQCYKTVKRYFKVRDNQNIFAYHFKKKSPITIILIHGIKSTGKDYLESAYRLQKATKSEVYAIDLRGHGQSDGNSGDVDYINQYTDDLEDIIKIIRKEKPKGKIIIAGHSMGGGIALLYAKENKTTSVDGYLLFAPLLGQNSPSFRTEKSVESKSKNDEFMKINIPRIIGLKMLNEIGMHEQDNLPVLHFNLPFGTPLRNYTYRANMSMAPGNYTDGLSSIKVPLLVIIGDKDDAFIAEEQQSAVEKNSSGKVIIIKDETHEGISKNEQAIEEFKMWFYKIKI